MMAWLKKCSFKNWVVILIIGGLVLMTLSSLVNAKALLAYNNLYQVWKTTIIEYQNRIETYEDLQQTNMDTIKTLRQQINQTY